MPIGHKVKAFLQCLDIRKLKTFLKERKNIIISNIHEYKVVRVDTLMQLIQDVFSVLTVISSLLLLFICLDGFLCFIRLFFTHAIHPLTYSIIYFIPHCSVA